MFFIPFQHKWQWMGFKNAVWDLWKYTHCRISTNPFVEDRGKKAGDTNTSHKIQFRKSLHSTVTHVLICVCVCVCVCVRVYVCVLAARRIVAPLASDESLCFKSRLPTQCRATITVWITSLIHAVDVPITHQPMLFHIWLLAIWLFIFQLHW